LTIPRYTIQRETNVVVDGKYADAVLGEFEPEGARFVVAVEGKGPRDPLERPHAGRAMSAVDQAYRYAINLPCDWILVTSMRQTRLYYKGADQSTYERFDLERLAEDDTLLRKFVFLMGAERVVPHLGPCHLDALRTASHQVGRELTLEYYDRYASMRHSAFNQLVRVNPSVPAADLLAATQKLLDRVLFCSFCEDRGLLPADTIGHAYGHADPYNPRPIWENFRGLFHAIDKGNPRLSIPAYNGGLFAADPILDRLEVPDEVCACFRDLAAYDYRPAHEAAGSDAPGGGRLIDVEILGHIFEQSITDLERLRRAIDEPESSPQPASAPSRRKKEGAFYTPAFITRYLVGQALGGVLNERFARLQQKHQEEAKSGAKQVLSTPRVYDLDGLNKPKREALIHFWEAWQDELGTVRLLDPACGSGAFLIEAFDQLYAAYTEANERLEELRGTRTLFDPDRQILQNNLYGVDLNDEAIEICRLSLWIKTAQHGKALTDLDHTIRVGNSVVDDPAVHPKAFNWQTAFPEVFAAGGFDAVVGNPPYVRQEWLAPYKEYWEGKFTTYNAAADIFTYFYELGIGLLRKGGRLGFITSGSWVRGNFALGLRTFLSQNAAIESMIDFGEYQPFEDAEMIRPTIAIIKKQQPSGDMRLFKWLTGGYPPQNLADVIATAPTMRIDHLGPEAWELEAEDVLALRKKLNGIGLSLKRYAKGRIHRGLLTGLNEVFAISSLERQQLIKEDPASAEVIKPFIQGTHLRPWFVEDSQQHLIIFQSSGDKSWPWSQVGQDAEAVFSQAYPAIYSHLVQHKAALVKRQDKGRFWWELRSCAYWDSFEEAKIVWPDISKLPRFSMDTDARYLGNTGYIIPGGDYFLLGVLASWATWFYISKTAQPLRLRAGRWQFRLIAQFMENLPVPNASEADRQIVADIARKCDSLGKRWYELTEKTRRRLTTTFAEEGKPDTFNNKAQSWWELSMNQLGDALKASFKLTGNPFKKPKVADEWEDYLDEKRNEVLRMARDLADAEAELNDRVYRLFDLTPEEIKLLKREVEH
jgi:hypothetical protein